MAICGTAVSAFYFHPSGKSVESALVCFATRGQGGYLRGLILADAAEYSSAWLCIWVLINWLVYCSAYVRKQAEEALRMLMKLLFICMVNLAQWPASGADDDFCTNYIVYSWFQPSSDWGSSTLLFCAPLGNLSESLLMFLACICVSHLMLFAFSYVLVVVSGILVSWLSSTGQQFYQRNSVLCMNQHVLWT